MANTLLTVQNLCDRYSVSPHTVLSWIDNGELQAINVGRRPGLQKPRWRITPEALAAFEQIRRASRAPPPIQRRKKTAEGVIRFY